MICDMYTGITCIYFAFRVYRDCLHVLALGPSTVHMRGVAIWPAVTRTSPGW